MTDYDHASLEALGNHRKPSKTWTKLQPARHKHVFGWRWAGTHPDRHIRRELCLVRVCSFLPEESCWCLEHDDRLQLSFETCRNGPRAFEIWICRTPVKLKFNIDTVPKIAIFESKHLFQNIIFGIHTKDRISFGPPSHSVALNAQVVPSSASTNLSPRTVNDFIFVQALHQLNETSLIYTEHLGKKIPKIAHVLVK